MSDFGKRLRTLRRSRDVNQTDLAKALGVRCAAVSKYEAEENAYPRVDTLIKLADYFDVSIDYLLRGKEFGCMATNGSVIQSNVHHEGDIVTNGRQMLSPEAAELLCVYRKLGGRERFELLDFAFKLEAKS